LALGAGQETVTLNFAGFSTFNVVLTDDATDTETANVNFTSGTNLTVTADMGAGSDVLQFSAVQTLTATLDMGAGNDTLTLASNVSTATVVAAMGAGNDTVHIYGNTVTATLDMGAGNDMVKIGSGNNQGLIVNATIDLGVGGTDTVQFGWTAAMALASLGVVTIGNFEAGTSGSDVIEFTAGFLANTGGGTTTGAVTVDLAATTWNALSDETAFIGLGTKVIIEIGGTGDVTNGADAGAVWAKIVGGTSGVQFTTTTISTQKLVFIVDDGTDSYLWYFNSSDSVASSGDLKLIGIVQGVTDFAAGDIIIV